MILNNEYLVIIDKDSSPGFFRLCNSTKRFNEYLTSENQIQINKNQISHKEKTFGYSIRRGKVKGKDQIFYYITLEFDGHEHEIESYKILVRQVKKSMSGENTIIETLKDDLSFHYSQKAYSLIHNIENLMRKFITYFMITNVGKNWVEESSPELVKSALSKSKRKQYIDALQQLDFIHLGDFLFKSYQDEDTSVLFEKISSLSKSDDIDIENLKGFIPKSNWEKYFRASVDCDDTYLKKRWEKLYELRNIIAHTSSFTENDHDEVKNLTSEVKEKLEAAFEKIDSVELPEEEKESISENIVTNMDKNIGEYLRNWHEIETKVRSFSKSYTSLNLIPYLETLKKTQAIDSETIDRINALRHFRNTIVHHPEKLTTTTIIKFNNEINEVNAALQASWKTEVIRALKSLNNEARLEEIYTFISDNTERKLPDSWRSSVRKTIHMHSSDTDSFAGKEDLFQHVEKGKWRLR